MRNGEYGITDNLKKATLELGLLALLSREDMHIAALTETYNRLTGEQGQIVFPYAAIYRLIEKGYIFESGKRNDANRRRQYLSITDEGRAYLKDMKERYERYIAGFDSVLRYSETPAEQ